MLMSCYPQNTSITSLSLLLSRVLLVLLELLVSLDLEEDLDLRALRVL